MRSQPGQQLQYTYCKISQEVKVIKKLYFKSHAENEARRLVPDLSLFFKKHIE